LPTSVKHTRAADDSGAAAWGSRLPGSSPAARTGSAHRGLHAEQCRAAARQAGQAPAERCRARPELRAPSALGPEARKEWQRLANELAPLGLLTRIDRGMLAAYCQAHALWVEAVHALERYGTMVTSGPSRPSAGSTLPLGTRATARSTRRSCAADAATAVSTSRPRPTSPRWPGYSHPSTMMGSGTCCPATSCLKRT
jgi:P27 family predicted phage terminase small subunit